LIGARARTQQAPLRKVCILRKPAMSHARRWSDRRASACVIQSAFRRRLVRRLAYDAISEALLDDESKRYAFWVLTDHELPGGESLLRRLSTFDAKAGRARGPDLENHRILRDTPRD
jgi:hypothetical protein